MINFSGLFCDFEPIKLILDHVSSALRIIVEYLLNLLTKF